MRPSFYTRHDKDRLVYATYWLGFLISLHGYLLVYINAPFLGTRISEWGVGLAFAISSLIAVGLFVFLPALLRRFGNYATTSGILALEACAVFGLTANPSLSLVLLFFTMHMVLIQALAFTADIFLETGTPNGKTGGIRGLFLTICNIALVLSPLVVGLVLDAGNDYWKVYALALCVLVPVFILLLTRFRTFRDPPYRHIAFFKTLRMVWRHKNIYRIFMSNILLRVFYAAMVIYTPLYLHDYLNFEWSTIGVMFTIMLIPFALLEYPLGYLADKRLGEKEILTLGFIVMGFVTILLTFVTSASVVVWTLLLFTTRIGASAVEVMNETYFFKHVASADSDIIGFFRMVQPLPYIIAPLVGTAVLAFFNIQLIFLAIGCITLYGVRYSLTLKDTR